MTEPGREDPPPDRMQSLLEQIQQALTPEEYRLLTRLTIDGASHLEVAEEFHISVYASQKRLERIRKKLYQQFPQWQPEKKL